jgi:hypothetical protein
MDKSWKQYVKVKEVSYKGHILFYLYERSRLENM